MNLLKLSWTQIITYIGSLYIALPTPTVEMEDQFPAVYTLIEKTTQDLYHAP